MKLTQLILVLCVAVSLSACGENSTQRGKGLHELQKITDRWFDGVQVTNSTPRISVAPLVANLQSIKRDLDAVEVSECLTKAKEALDEYMRTAILGYTLFMADNPQTGFVMYSAEAKRDDYLALRKECTTQEDSK